VDGGGDRVGSVAEIGPQADVGAHTFRQGSASAR
jgi:hypothetical protein